MQETNKTNTVIKNSQKTQALPLDFERLIPRLINHWPLFVASILLALGIAYYLNNWHFSNVYQSSATFRVGSGINSNSAASASNSINFIWGGSNNRVQTLSYVMSSRTHNNFVVKETQGYVFYYEEGRLKKSDSYKLDAPYNIEIDTTHNQIINQEIYIEPVNETTFKISRATGTGRVYNYQHDSIINRKGYLKTPMVAKYNQWIEGTNYRFKVKKNHIAYLPDYKYSYKLVTLNEAISRAAQNITIAPIQNGSNIVSVKKTATNLNEATDVINNSLKVLMRNELAEKNLAANKTKNYIKDQLSRVKNKLDSASNNLTALQQAEGIYDFPGKKSEIISGITELDRQRVMMIDKINSLNSLIPKANNSVNNMIALNIAGLDVAYYMSYVNEIESLENQKKEMLMIYQPQAEEIRLIDEKIREARNSIDNVVRAHRQKLNTELRDIESKLSEYEYQAQFLPQQEFNFLEANRGFAINDEVYNNLMTQLNNAELQIASNVSDILIVDEAKNLGQRPIYPDHKGNYLKALLIGFLIPFVYVVLRELFDTKVKVIKDITTRTDIPLLGMIGNLGNFSPLVVINRPKSGISESFRAVRSNIKFLYKKPNLHPTNKTILVTSFISGEGKTFVSMNIASVFGAGDKRTLLIGLDLRKPKIFDDFKINNYVGVTNYLVEDIDIQEVIQRTELPNLDVITAGPIPPNPSELILSSKMEQMIHQLKDIYDYIIIDSPPIGLVSDSYDLMKFADATLYISRHNYSERNFLKVIDSRYKDGELTNIGIVLNDYQVKMGYGYGYGSEYGYGVNYGYGYGYGYFEEDEYYENNWVGIIKRFFSQFSKKSKR